MFAGGALLLLACLGWFMGSDMLGIGADPGQVRMPTKGWPGYAPFYIANEMNLCDGVELKFFEVIDVEEMIKFISHTGEKKADMGAWLVDTHVLARSEGVPAVAVLKLDTSLAADALITHTSIQEFAQLKGKRIAYQRKEPSHSMLLKLCHDNNMTLQSFEVCKNTDPEKAVAMFRQGTVDAAISYEPWLGQAEDAMNVPDLPKQIHRLVDGNYLLEHGHPIVDILVVREDFLADHPKRVKSVIKGWFRALKKLTDTNDADHKVAVGHFCDFMTHYAPKLDDTPYNYDDFMELIAPSNMLLADATENEEFFQQREGMSLFRNQLQDAVSLWNEIDRSMLGDTPFEAKSTAAEAGDGWAVLREALQELRSERAGE